MSRSGSVVRLSRRGARSLLLPAVQAHAGFLSVNDGRDGIPVVPGVPSADMAAGLTGLAAVLMALIGRQATGKGDYLDIAMFDSLLPWCAPKRGRTAA